MQTEHLMSSSQTCCKYKGYSGFVKEVKGDTFLFKYDTWDDSFNVWLSNDSFNFMRSSLLKEMPVVGTTCKYNGKSGHVFQLNVDHQEIVFKYDGYSDTWNETLALFNPLLKFSK